MSKPPVDLGAPGRSGDLSRLDPWSFRVLPDGAFGVDSVVVGTTGTFVLLVTGASPGVLPLAKVRRAARRIRAVQSAAGIHLPVYAVLCVQGPSFVPRDRAGVRVIPRLLLVREITERTRVALPHQAERAATSLRKAAG